MSEALSSVLKRRRRELGLTLAQIAERIGVSEATVQRWESGNINSLRYDRISALAEILHVSPAEIMGWSSDTGPDNGTAPAQNLNRFPRAMSTEELKFALWGDAENISDKDLEDVRRYAAFIMERKRQN